MLTKLDLLAILQEETGTKAYFLSRKPKMLYVQNFDYWDNQNPNCPKELHGKLLKTGLLPLIVEMDVTGGLSYLAAKDSNGNLIRVNVNTQTAIQFGQYHDLPIFIDRKLLIRNGMLITKQFIEEILLC